MLLLPPEEGLGLRSMLVDFAWLSSASLRMRPTLDVLLHELLQPVLQFFRCFIERKVHKLRLLTGKRGRSFFQKVRDTFFEVFAL
jgi:hypothetical protein